MPSRWSADKLAATQATPWSLREKPGVGVHSEEPAADAGVAVEVARPSAPEEFRRISRSSTSKDTRLSVHSARESSGMDGHDQEDVIRRRAVLGRWRRSNRPGLAGIEWLSMRDAWPGPW